MQNRSLAYLGSATLALLLSACGGGSSSGGSGPVAGENTVVVSTVAADGSGSDIQLIDLEQGLTAMPGIAPTDKSDTTALRYDEHFYRLGRFNIDKLTKYSFDNPSVALYEYSTLNDPEEPTGNPYTVVFASEEKAYVIQYGKDEIAIINPSAQSQDDFITGGIDLSAYADGDASGAVEASDGVIVDGKLFVVMQRLVGYSPAEEGVSAYIAVFDIDTDEEIDTNPNDDAGNLKGIELSTRNPNKFVYQQDLGLLLQSTGDAFYGFNGREPGYTGGITEIDTNNYTETVVVDDGGDYGFVFDLAVIDENDGYFVAGESFIDDSYTSDYNLYRFNPSTGDATAVADYSSVDFGEITAGPQGNLWIGIVDPAQPRIELFDGENTVETIGLLQNPGAILFSE